MCTTCLKASTCSSGVRGLADCNGRASSFSRHGGRCRLEQTLCVVHVQAAQGIHVLDGHCEQRGAAARLWRANAWLANEARSITTSTADQSNGLAAFFARPRTPHSTTHSRSHTLARTGTECCTSSRSSTSSPTRASAPSGPSQTSRPSLAPTVSVRESRTALRSRALTSV